MIDKDCELCGVKMYNVIHNKKFCSNCKSRGHKIKEKEYHEKVAKKKVDDMRMYLENFIENNDASLLTPPNFKKAAKYSTISVTLRLKKSWFELMSDYNKTDEIYEYVKSEYMNYYKSTGISSVEKFVKASETVSQDVLKFYGPGNLKKDCGFSLKGTHKEYDVKLELDRLIEELGGYPNRTEFDNLSSMSSFTAIRVFSDDKSWENVIYNVYGEEGLSEYKSRFENYLSEIGKINSGYRKMYSEIELENEFRRVFDTFYKKHGKYPVVSIFNKFSNICSNAYKKRFKCQWFDIVKMYNYPLTYKETYTIENGFYSEQVALEVVSNLLDEDYIPQMRWTWLKSDIGATMQVDGYFEKNNLVVEYDGVQHRKAIDCFGGEYRYNRQVANDKLKDQLLNEHGIKLLRIPSNEDWHEEEYIINKLSEIGIEVNNYTTNT